MALSRAMVMLSLMRRSEKINMVGREYKLFPGTIPAFKRAREK
jgi:hypothetical protein